jgi:two-component system sensor histidine kinase QseC
VRSIRVFLATSIVSLLTLFNFVAAVQGYQSSMREADALFDNQMLDLALLVSNLDVSDERLRSLQLGDDLAFQVWQNNELLAASANAPRVALHEFADGYDYANFNSYRWRTLSRFDQVHEKWVFIAERMDLRFVLAENVVLQSVGPLLLGIPLVGLLVWAFVSRGLAPLRKLSSVLKAKPANDLTPIDFGDSRLELDQVVASINGFVARLGSAMDREKSFSADAAHELRTPISALKIQLHNLASTVDAETDAYRELQQGIDRMQHLIEQLLALYRSSAEQFNAKARPVNLLDIAQDAVARLYPEFERKNQQIAIEGDEQLGREIFTIYGEPFALETLLTNLLTNASRYTPLNGQIVVSLSTHSDKVILSVEDDGEGIALEDRARIFDRFTRLSGAQTGGVSGCGLGLAIVRHVADLHGALVKVTSSRFDTGTAFIVEFTIEGAVNNGKKDE